MNIILTISEGEKYKYRNFSWEGMSLFSENDLQKKHLVSKRVTNLVMKNLTLLYIHEFKVYTLTEAISTVELSLKSHQLE